MPDEAADYLWDTAACKAFVILDGTPLAIDRIAAERPYYCGSAG